MSRALLLVIAACQAPAPVAQPDPADLVRELERIRGSADRDNAVAHLALGSDAWGRIIVEPFRRLYDDYSTLWPTRIAALARQLGPGEITARRHFAGDPRLTPSQGRLRWVVPVLYPSMVAEIAGRPIDTVFVFDGTGWRALDGIDASMLAIARRLDPACADRLAQAGPTGHCSEVGWAIADAAMREDRPAFTHACQLATTLCGTRSP